METIVIVMCGNNSRVQKWCKVQYMACYADPVCGEGSAAIRAIWFLFLKQVTLVKIKPIYRYEHD
jgi:hypothetical protein